MSNLKTEKMKTMGTLLGLKTREGYPIFYNEDKTTKQRQYGEFNCPITLLFERDYSKMAHYSGCSKKEVYCEISFEDLYDNMCLIGNDANPREPKYVENERGDIIRTFIDTPELLREISHGASILASEAEVSDDGSVVKFKVPHIDDSNLTGQIKYDAQDENKRYGLYDGQNLWALACSFVEKVRSLPKKDAEYLLNNVPLSERFIRVNIKVIDKAVPLWKIVRIVKGKNSVEKQEKTAMATHMNAFRGLIPMEVIDLGGLEEKTNADLYKLATVKDTKESDSLYKSEVYSSVSLPMAIFASHVGIISTTQDFINSNIVKLYDSSKGAERKEYYDSFKAKIGYPIGLSRHKTSASNVLFRVINPITGEVESPCEYDSVLNAELLCDYFVNAFDFVTTYDYSNVNTSVLKTLGIKKAKKPKLSAWTNNAIKYEIPLLVMNFIPFIYSSMCKTIEDSDGRTLVIPQTDFRPFWDANYIKILERICTLRSYGTSDTDVHDSFNLCTKEDDRCVKTWDDLRMLTSKYMKGILSMRKVA